MTSPLQTIENTIISRLKNITVANGYSFGVGTVAREDRDVDKWDPSVLDIIIQLLAQEPNPGLFCPGNPPGQAWNATWRITGFHKQLDVDVTEFGIKSKNVTEDVMSTAMRKAIYNSSATWYTLGTTACKESDFISIDPVDGLAHDAVSIGLLCQYRVSLADAEVAR